MHFSFQTEIDQLTITSDPGDVGEQCSLTSRDAGTDQEKTHQRQRRNHEQDDEGGYQYAFPLDGGFHNEWSHMDWSLQVIYLSVSLPKEIFSLITHKIISFSAAPLSLSRYQMIKLLYCFKILFSKQIEDSLCCTESRA